MKVSLALTLTPVPLRFGLVDVDFTADYSRKTDDEVLALAVDTCSLEPKAQSALLDD